MNDSATLETLRKASTSKPQLANTVDVPRASVNSDPATRGEAQKEVLLNLLEQSKTVCSLIGHNFGGDGSFDDPSRAPGIAALVACATDLTRAAAALADEINVPLPTSKVIWQASGLAEHLKGLSEEMALIGAEHLGMFRIGDHQVSMAYWTIEKLIAEALLMPICEARA